MFVRATVIQSATVRIRLAGRKGADLLMGAEKMPDCLQLRAQVGILSLGLAQIAGISRLVELRGQRLHLLDVRLQLRLADFGHRRFVRSGSDEVADRKS